LSAGSSHKLHGIVSPAREYSDFNRRAKRFALLRVASTPSVGEQADELIAADLGERAQ